MPVDAVLHPASASAQRIAKEQKDKAAAVLEDEQRKLASPEYSKDPLRAPTVPAESPRISKTLGVWLAGLAAVTVVVTIVNEGEQLIDGVRKIFAISRLLPPLRLGDRNGGIRYRVIGRDHPRADADCSQKREAAHERQEDRPEQDQ